MTEALRAKPIDILLVEDNLGDARLTERALAESKLINNIYHVKDGVEATDFLNQANGYEDAPRPDLVLLDLNLPKKDGRDVLAQIKNDDALKMIPVVVLTSSELEQDILKSYALHANCYVTKPVNLDSFLSVVQSIEGFWVSVVKLPASFDTS